MNFINIHAKKSIWPLSVLIVSSFGLFACQNSSDRSSAVSPEHKDAKTVNPLVAKIEDIPVYYDDVRRFALEQGLISAHQSASQPANSAPASSVPMDIAIFGKALDRLIDQKVLAEDARRRQDDLDEDVQRRLNAARERLLSSVRIEAHIRDVVTEEAMRELYTRQAALTDRGDEIRARHILLADKAAADEVLKAINDGADFEALASQLSKDKDTRDRGGDLDYFTYDMLPPDFSKAVFTQMKTLGKDMRLLKPFETQKGWHIVEILDRRRVGAKSYEESRPALRRFLTFEAIETLLSDLRDKADVELLEFDAPMRRPSNIPFEP